MSGEMSKFSASKSLTPAWKWLWDVCETYAISHKKQFAPSVRGIRLQKLIDRDDNVTKSVVKHLYRPQLCITDPRK